MQEFHLIQIQTKVSEKSTFFPNSITNTSYESEYDEFLEIRETKRSDFYEYNQLFDIECSFY